MIVVDASVLVAAIVGFPLVPGVRERLAAGDLAAPHLLDVEVLQALRRFSLAGSLSDPAAARARSDLRDLPIVRYPHAALAARIWDLRRNLTAYDAAYIALAEALDAPLVTCDARLVRSSGHVARVELLGAD